MRASPSTCIAQASRGRSFMKITSKSRLCPTAGDIEPAGLPSQTPRVCRKAWQCSNLAGRGSIPRRGAYVVGRIGNPSYINNCPRGVLEIARDPAKVEDQVRFLARTLPSVECGIRNAELMRGRI